MTKSKGIVKLELSVPWIAILLGLLAYVFWGLQAGVVTGVFSYFALGWLPFLGFVPIAGPFLYWGAFTGFRDWLLSLSPAAHANPLFGLIFWVGMIFAIIYTCISTFILLAVLASAAGK